MPETRVPMTLRDHFLQDPFFKSAWEDMESFRNNFFQSSSSKSSKMIENTERKSSDKSLAKFDEGNGGWMLPRKWMLPSILDDGMLKMNDSGVINMVDDDTKMEISLNTSGYKPGELSINVTDGQLVIEGKHEEKTESGHTMVSRHFRRQYGLSPNVKMTEVVSNLSQDGVLVVTVPKEKRIQEIKEDRKIDVEHKKSQVEQRKESTSSQKINVERKSSTGSSTSSEKKTKATSMVPMNLRDTFLDDPFFQDNWLDIQQSQKNFFSKAQEQFQQQMQKMESAMNERFSLSSFFDNDSDFKLPSLNLKDEHELKVVSDNNKLEISLDTSGYKPDELKVTAGQGVICVEAKHEEKTEAGDVMVSRHMSRVYPLPSNAQPEQVHSNLSKDGVLVISVPKSQQIQQQDRNVPIEMKR